jgi:V8-like Glu-specific endopeptidase
MKSLLALSALSLFASLPSQAAIFGADNRMPIGPNTPFHAIQQATAVGLLSSMEEPGPNGTINLVAPNHEGKICASERFVKDPSLSYACTAFLIGPDLLLTAGHCAVNVGVSEHETNTFCKAFSWLFDYAPDINGRVKTSGIDPDKVYRCQETIYAIKEEVAPYRDFALIRLNRPVLGRTPLKLSSDPVKKNDVLSMVGYPLGTPAKSSTNGRVLVNDAAKEIMVTTLDSFEGNSGSPVLNAKKEVVGILIGGFPSDSFLDDPVKGCKVLNRCDENGLNCKAPDTDFTPFPYYQVTGSEVQKLDSVREILKRIQ